MNNMPLISIIVPAYNAEKWIESCCDSVIHQSYINWELIIIDDGSTDKTYECAKNIAKKIDNINVIHVDNGGVSRARNLGITKSKGDYIIFLDADDLLTKNALEIMYNEMTKHRCDIVIGWKMNIDLQGNEIGVPYYTEELCWTKSNALKMSLRDHPATYAVWGKLYKKDFINQIRFEEGRAIHEDSYFLFECFCLLPNVRVINEIVLKYRIVPGSASRGEFSEKYLDILYFAEKKKALILKEFPEFKDLAENIYVKANMTLLKNLLKCESSKYKWLEKECIKNIVCNKKSFVVAIPEDRKWFWIVSHHLYFPYKYLRKLIRNI